MGGPIIMGFAGLVVILLLLCYSLLSAPFLFFLPKNPPNIVPFFCFLVSSSPGSVPPMPPLETLDARPPVIFIFPERWSYNS